MEMLGLTGYRMDVPADRHCNLRRGAAEPTKILKSMRRHRELRARRGNKENARIYNCIERATEILKNISTRRHYELRAAAEI